MFGRGIVGGGVGSVVGGAGRLTDAKVDQMQNYYGQAIRANVGDLQHMKNDIWAVFKHMICDDTLSLEEQHANCPRDTWCKFWTNPSQYDDSKRLPPVFVAELKPLFVRLSDSELLSRCLKGLTQNQNESINGILWSRCPKTKFCGLKKLNLFVAEAVAYFNGGVGSTVCVQQFIVITRSHNMYTGLLKRIVCILETWLVKL